MTYVIGIDGGGTKTKAILADETGQVYGSVTTGPSNPNTVSKTELNVTIEHIFNELKRQARSEFLACSMCFAGMSGTGEAKNYNLLEEIFLTHCSEHDIPFAMNNDAINALYAGTLGEDGIVHISGTGSITLSLFNQKINRVGGWGYLFDDLGSGYAIGNETLAAVFQEYDGRGGVTSLIPQLLEKFNVAEVPDLIKIIYKAPNPRVIIAEISQLTFEKMIEGDNIATSIIHQAGSDIAHSIQTLLNKENRENVPVVLAGGIFNQKDLLIPIIQKQLPHQVKLIGTKVDPVFGAVVAALKHINIKVGDEFTQRATL